MTKDKTFNDEHDMTTANYVNDWLKAGGKIEYCKPNLKSPQLTKAQQAERAAERTAEQHFEDQVTGTRDNRCDITGATL